MNALELVEVLEGLDVPMFAEIDIAECEYAGPLRAMLLRSSVEADVDTVVITNDPSYRIGVQLWPQP